MGAASAARRRPASAIPAYPPCTSLRITTLESSLSHSSPLLDLMAEIDPVPIGPEVKPVSLVHVTFSHQLLNMTFLAVHAKAPVPRTAATTAQHGGDRCPARRLSLPITVLIRENFKLK